MEYRRQFGRYAVVVGASVTVGEEFARQLAGRGMDVVLVARRLEKLSALAAELGDRVDVRLVAADLDTPEGRAALLDEVGDLDVGVLVLNANLHRVAPFHGMDLETKLRMIRMNVELPTLLLHHIGAGMVERGRGAIVFVNVLNALTPLSIDAVFQGTKAYLRLLAESVWLEYRRAGVRVATVLVSGIEGSESYERKLSPASRRRAKLFGGSMYPRLIVARALRQLEQGRWVLIPDAPVPVNAAAVALSEASRVTRSTRLARLWSTFFEGFLDGHEVGRGDL